MKTVMIEFCQSNVAQGSATVMNQLLEQEGLDCEVIEYGCLGNCGQCFSELFAMVNGKIVAAKTSDALLTAINDHLVEEVKADEEWKKLGF